MDFGEGNLTMAVDQITCLNVTQLGIDSKANVVC